MGDSHLLRLALLLLLSGSLAAAPPDVKIPDELKPVGQFAVFKPDAEVVDALYIPRDGADRFPIELISDDPKALRNFIFDTRGLPDGLYRFHGVFSNAKGEMVRKDFGVLVGKGGTPPKDPPTKPPVTGGKFFAVVREDGPASPAMTKVLGLPEWATLKAKGHDYKDYTKSEAESKGIKLPAGLPLPAVLTFTPTGTVNGKPVYSQTPAKHGAAPTNGTDILKLAE